MTVGEGRYRRWPVWSVGAGHTQVPRSIESMERPTGPSDGTYVGRMVVRAWSVGWLRCLLDDPVSLTRVRRVSVRIDSWHIPQRGWSGRLGAVAHLISHRVRTPHMGHGRAVVDVELRWSVPLRDVVAAILPVLTPLHPLPAPVSADVTARAVLPRWLGTRRNVSAVLGELPDNADIRPHDLVLTAPGAAPPRPAPGSSPRPEQPSRPDPSPRPGSPTPEQPTPEPSAPAPGSGRPATAYYGGLLSAATPGAGPSAVPGVEPGAPPAPVSPPAIVVVDLEHAGVRGRYGPFGPAGPNATLTFGTGATSGTRPTSGVGPDTGRWQVVAAEGDLLYQGRLGRPYPVTDLRPALAEVAVLRCPSLPARQPLAEAALLVDLALAGVLVHAPDLPPACAAYLSPEVVALFTGALPGERADALEWEIRAVRQRRAVMRDHGAQFALPALSADAFPGIIHPPSVSALLVTKRLEHVAAVLGAIETQTYPNLEIVLCTHGVELSAELRARVAACTRPVETITLPAGHGFGEAIGETTARARGSLVTKFDDDDTYGPEHVWDLVLARHYSGATMVGKGAEFVYLQTLDTTVRRDPGTPEAFTSVVAGGTMLIDRGDLEAVGGWRPVPRSIDRGLIDRVRRAGGLIYRTHPLGYVYHRHSGGHTWDPGLEYFLRGAGMQWSGLPRYPEFGTAGPVAEPPAVAVADPPADPARRPASTPPLSGHTVTTERRHPRPPATANR